MNVRLSIVIVNWNTRDILLDCIRSIESTSGGVSLEVIVVDNGSRDGSAEAVERMFPNCIVIRNAENRGFAAANNVGIVRASGKYICLVNSDVEVLDSCFQRMCDYMDENPSIGALGPKILNRDLTLQRSCSELPSLRNALMQAVFLDRLFPGLRWFRNRFMESFDYQRATEVPVLSGCFLMARREAIEEVGLLDEDFFMYKEDVDWCKRIGDAGWKVSFSPSARAIHYGGASSASAPARFLIELEKANRQYFRKHHSRLQGALMNGICALHYFVRLIAWQVISICRPGLRPSARERVAQYGTCLGWMTGRGGKIRNNRVEGTKEVRYPA